MFSRLIVLCGFALAACSPYSARKDLADAEHALTSADRAQAARLAPYEYTAAAEYLHKAQEENAYADYEGARVFARRAVELAERAQSVAQAQHPAPPPPPPSSDNAHEMP